MDLNLKMIYPTRSSSKEELNFLKGCLLVTKVIPNGLKKFLLQKLTEDSKSGEQDLKLKALEFQENISNYNFQQLCALAEYTDRENDVATLGVNHFITAREQLFKNTRAERLSEHELERLIQEVHKGYISLKLHFHLTSDVPEMFTLKDNDNLIIYEQLSKETRTFCHLSLSQYPAVIQRPREVSLVLNKLREVKKSPNSSRNSTFYICGPHGCGKSEIAKQVATILFNEHKKCSKDPTVLMILDAETEDSLLCSYVRFAKDILGNLLHIHMAATSKGITTGQKIRLLKCIIEPQMKKYSNWVVIIDNVHDLGKFSSYWPKPGTEDWGCGYIIVTSVNSITAQTLSSQHSEHLTIAHGMQPSEATEILCGVSGVADKTFALDVAELLEFQPVALNCAAAFVKILDDKGKNEPWKMYLKNFYNQKSLTSQRLCQENDNNYSEMSRVAMEMLVSRLSAQHKIVPSILFLLSIFDPFPVSWNVILNSLKQLGITCKENTFQALLKTILIESSQENSALFISRYNKMYKNFVDLELTNAKKISILGSAITAVGLEMTNPQYSKSEFNETIYYWSFLADKLMERFSQLNLEERKECSELFKTVLSVSAAVNVLVEFGKQCQLIQKLESAKASFEMAKTILEDTCDKDDSSWSPQFYSVLRGLGQVSNMFHPDTRRYFERASRICRDAGNAVNIHVLAQIIDDLGDVSISSGETAEAKTLYKEALELRKKVPDSDDTIAVSVSWFKLGNVHGFEGDFNQAKEYYEKALMIWDSSKPEAVDYELATILTRAGAMSICVNEFETAFRYLERAMEMEGRLLSVYHPYRLNTIKNASNACKALNYTEKAENLLRQSIEISQKVVGLLDNKAAQVYSELGSLSAAKCKWETAINYHNWSLKVRENTLCHLHPDIADACCHLGNAYNNFGDLEKAKMFHERSLGIRGLLFERNHPDVGLSFFRLGEVYSKLDDHETALNLLERAVEIHTRTYGCNHPDTLTSLKLLGDSFARLGQLKRAQDLYQTVVHEQSKLIDKETDIAQTVSSLAEVSLRLGDVDAAKEQYRRAIEMQKKGIGDDHPEMARPLVGLALVHEHCKEFKEAKGLLEKALVIYRKNLSNHPKVLMTEMHLTRVIAKLPHLGCLLM